MIRGKLNFLWAVAAFTAGLAIFTGVLVITATQNRAENSPIEERVVFAPSLDEDGAAQEAADASPVEQTECSEESYESEQCVGTPNSDEQVESEASEAAEADSQEQAFDSSGDNTAGSQQTDWVVPELLGANVNEAAQALKLLGFTNVELVELADRKARNVVVYSSVRAGSKPNKSQKVTLGFVRYSYSSKDLLIEWRDTGTGRDGFVSGTDNPMRQAARSHYESLGSPKITCLAFRPYMVRIDSPSIVQRKAESTCYAATGERKPALVLSTLDDFLDGKSVITQNY